MKNGSMRSRRTCCAAMLATLVWVVCGSWGVAAASAQPTPPFDIDNDGVDELLVAETGYDTENPVIGLVRVVSGATGEQLLEVQSSRTNDCFVAIAGPCGQYIGLTWPSQQFVIYIAFGWPLGGEYTWSVSGAEDVVTDGPICIARVSRPGTLRADVTYTIDGCNASAFCESRVVRADLDIDSDNDNDFGRPDRSSEEEDVEDILNDELLPGKVVLANTLDFDNDGIPGYADGYNLLQHADFEIDDRDETADFPFAVLGLSKLYCDDAKIRISYDASPPLGVRQTVNAPFVLPEGSLRLWRNDRPDRDPRPVKDGGHYIAPGEYTREEIGLVDGKASRRFYVEVVRPSQVPGDIDITVEYSPREDVGYIARDRVRITGSKIELWGAGYGESPTPVAGLIATEPVGLDDNLPETMTPGAWMSYFWRVYDPRPSVLDALFVDRWPLPLLDHTTHLYTEEFMCYRMGYDGPLSGDSEWVVLTQNPMPCEYWPIWQQPSADIELVEQPKWVQNIHIAIDEAIDQLEDDQWDGTSSIDGTTYKYNDSGAFGKEVHKRVSLELEGKPQWVTDIWIDNRTNTVLRFGGTAPEGVRSIYLTQVDTMYLKQGYTLEVGDVVNPNKVEDLFDIKTSLNLTFGSDQRRRLKKVIGDRDVRKAVPVKRWSRSKGWHLHAKGARLRTGMRIIGAGAVAGLGTAVSIIMYSDLEKEFEIKLEMLIIEFQREENPEMRASVCKDLMYEIAQFFGNFAPGGSNAVADIISLGVIYVWYPAQE